MGIQIFGTSVWENSGCNPCVSREIMYTWMDIAGRQSPGFYLEELSSFRGIQQCLSNLLREESSRRYKSMEGEPKRSYFLTILSLSSILVDHTNIHSHSGWRQMLESPLSFTKHRQLHLRFILPSSTSSPSPRPQKGFLNYHSPSCNLSPALSTERCIHPVN